MAALKDRDRILLEAIRARLREHRNRRGELVSAGRINPATDSPEDDIASLLRMVDTLDAGLPAFESRGLGGERCRALRP